MNGSQLQELSALSSVNNTPSAFVILNPVAGNCTPTLRQAIQQHFRANHWQCEIYETSGQENIRDIVSKALRQKVSLIVAAGGDGTISSAVDGLVHSKVPLGIIPLGTGNIVAQELGLPLDPTAAYQLLTGKNTTTKIDVMQVGHQAFISHLSVGIYALIAQDTPPENKQRLGRLVYVWSALKKIMSHPTWRFKVTVDGQTRWVRASLIMVANAGTVGITPFRWGTNIRPDDGQIDVCIFRAKTLTDYLKIIWYALLNKHRQDDNISYLTATDQVEIVAHKPLPIRGDGEIIGQTPVQVQVVPQAVRVIVPLTQATRRAFPQ
jgi:YegS/Rv2252/BmrU family lipid kinase